MRVLVAFLAFAIPIASAAELNQAVADSACHEDPTCCADGATWTGSACECEDGAVWSCNTKTCSCPHGATWNFVTKKCSCSDGADWNGNDCVCADGAVWNDHTKACSCEDGAVWNFHTKSCSCPNGADWSGNSCKCADGAVWNSETDTCTCGGGATWDFSLKHCTCLHGEVWDCDAKTCKCEDEECHPTHPPIRTCPPGSFWDGTACKCKNHFEEYVDGSCKQKESLCGPFSELWTLLNGSPLHFNKSLCAFHDSDFAALSLSLDGEAENLKHLGKLENFNCYVAVADEASLDKVGETELVNVHPDAHGHIHVEKQFAVELVHEPSTAPHTGVKLHCDFTFPHGAIKCSDSFLITDCSPPHLEPADCKGGVCKAGECLDPNGVPGPYEACNGQVFTTVSESSILKTVVKPVSNTCCKGCNKELECVPIEKDFDVKRCEPKAEKLSLLALDSLVLPHHDELNWTMIISGASMLVAVVTLVVVMKLRSNAHATTTEDGIYSLLE